MIRSADQSLSKPKAAFLIFFRAWTAFNWLSRADILALVTKLS
jgi:hypothetical protein